MFLGSTAPVPAGARSRSGHGTRSHEDNAVTVQAAASTDPLASADPAGSDDPTGSISDDSAACGVRVDGAKSGLASAGSGPATAVAAVDGTHDEEEGDRVTVVSHSSLNVLVRVLTMPDTADVLTMVWSANPNPNPNPSPNFTPGTRTFCTTSPPTTASSLRRSSVSPHAV